MVKAGHLYFKQISLKTWVHLNLEQITSLTSDSNNYDSKIKDDQLDCVLFFWCLRDRHSVFCP